jgi:NADH-quinone oxidoreductase subunit M
MIETGFPVLTVLVFSPLAVALVLIFLKDERTIKFFSIGVSSFVFLLSLLVYFSFSTTVHTMQFEEKASWIEGFGVSYHLGVDGISLLLVLLTALLFMLGSIYSWNIRDRVKEYFFFLLIMETAIQGVFLSLDLFLFFIFWEAMIIPMYFMIIMWGHENRIYAGFKFFIYTLSGSLIMLVSILALYFIHGSQTGQYTFDLFDLYGTDISPTVQYWLFLGFFISFAVKIPLLPLHTWLPDAHTEAPTVGSVILAGLLLKTAGYGFIRFSIPLFPIATSELAPMIIILSVCGIIYAPMMCLAQKDLKRLIAYSSIGHLGFVVLGIFVMTRLSVEGAILQMVNHGITTGALFLLAGMIYERAKTREISEFGGLWKEVPVLSAFLLLFSLSSMGLPGLNNFIGEFLVLVGAFKGNEVIVIVALLGILTTAVYFLQMLQKVIFGPKKKEYGWKDLSVNEVSVLTVLAILMFFIGLYPQPFLNTMDSSVMRLIEISEMR